MSIKSISLALLLSAGAVLSGCASLPPDSTPAVAAALDERGLAWETPTDGSLPAEYIGKPLGRADALHIALQGNPDLRAQFAQLGFAAADVYEAGRLSNPRLSASILFPDQGGEANQVGFGIAQSFTELLLLPAHRRLAEGELQRVQQLVAAAVLGVASDVDAAWIRLAAAERKAELEQAIAETAQTSALLAQKFFDAGNISRLELARERASASEAELERIAADAERVRARAELNRLLGFDAGETRWRTDSGLAKPAEEPPAVDALLVQAASTRLDIAAARRAVDLRADAAGLRRRTRLLGDLELGLETERETDRSRITGPTLGLELPLFNQGQGRVARAEAELVLAQAELRALELDVGREVRSAHADATAAWLRAQQIERVLVPLREQLVALTQEQLNFMLVGQFEALLTRREQYAAYGAWLDAVRDYWLARIELARAVGRTLPIEAGEAIEPPLAPPGAAQPSAHGAHEGHQMPAGHDMHQMHDMPGMDGQQDHDMHQMQQQDHGTHEQHQSSEGAQP